MKSTYSKLKLALLVALPVEAVNFWVIGYPAGAHPISRLSQYPAVALQWYLLHLPGIIAIDRSVYLREHAALDSVVLFLAGYIDTVILFVAIRWLVRLARRALRKLSSPREASGLGKRALF